MANFLAGARRVRIVGQCTVVLGTVVLGLFFALPSYRDFIALLFSSLFMLLTTLVIGLFVWAIGWTLEGLFQTKVGKQDR
jgi:hypothetical protein